MKIFLIICPSPSPKFPYCKISISGSVSEQNNVVFYVLTNATMFAGNVNKAFK